MEIHALRIKNFRRLSNVYIDLASDISIFVGANNSGKTSTAQALFMFTNGLKDRFSIYDFSSECWEMINKFGDNKEDASLPKMYMDIWFKVNHADVHRVLDILPGLDWEGSLVGVRVEFSAIDADKLLTQFTEARDAAQNKKKQSNVDDDSYSPYPNTLVEYLNENLRHTYEFKYYVLDYSCFDNDFEETPGYSPSLITPSFGRSAREVLKSLLRVDFLGAQRHLSDNSIGSRAENISHRLSRYYERNLEQHEDDYQAMHSLHLSKSMLDQHLSLVFKPLLSQMERLGYPGIENLRPIIKSQLNPATFMSSQEGARVHYLVDSDSEDENAATLPDNYNGLGYKNLIYILIELLDLHTQWVSLGEERPPLHLLIIEEPEVHLHAQLQQVFIREIFNSLELAVEDRSHFHNQFIVTTHSSHILFERGFKPIRYFRRTKTPKNQSTTILNLSTYYENTDEETRDFLERYLKLTHCDLFFADAAILVEGNVERLLMPLMIKKAAPKLNSVYLIVLEVGGAFEHRFRKLIEFLGITTLLITDLDSVKTPAPLEGDSKKRLKPKACLTNELDAKTSNQTLIKWLPKKEIIADILSSSSKDKIQQINCNSQALIRVAYQTPIDINWQSESINLAGRTLEEAFAFENLEWCQEKEQADLKLYIKKNDSIPLNSLINKLHSRIKQSNFKKTDFALCLLATNEDAWKVPSYIREGLNWLEEEVTPKDKNKPEAVSHGIDEA